MASRYTLAVCFAVFATSLVGCSTEPEKPQQHPCDAILKDPMGYKPQMDEDPNISGGGLMHLDKKGLKKDWDVLVNP